MSHPCPHRRSSALIGTPTGTVHLLASHPAPPGVDGPEDRNGARNAAEIRLWREYISPGDKPWLCDDAGRCGGLDADARFVIAGDLNNDPTDGDGRHEAIVELLEHPRVLRHATRSEEHTSELQSLMRISYAVFCLKKHK